MMRLQEASIETDVSLGHGARAISVVRDVMASHLWSKLWGGKRVRQLPTLIAVPQRVFDMLGGPAALLRYSHIRT